MGRRTVGRVRAQGQIVVGVAAAGEKTVQARGRPRNRHGFEDNLAGGGDGTLERTAVVPVLPVESARQAADKTSQRRRGHADRRAQGLHDAVDGTGEGSCHVAKSVAQQLDDVIDIGEKRRDGALHDCVQGIRQRGDGIVQEAVDRSDQVIDRAVQRRKYAVDGAGSA